jgi:zinc and cadmium transporter
MDIVDQWWMSLAAAAIVSLVSFSGAFTLWMAPVRMRQVVPILVSLAVGVLLGDAFMHLIPDATDKIGSLPTVCLYVVLGILLFFAIEKVVRWRHEHEVFDQSSRSDVSAMARMNLIGDAIHNFTDGVLIAGSFAAGTLVGVTTTLAIVVHEIPQEIGDVGALIHGGYAPRRAIFVNFLCALTVIAGVIFTLIVGHWAEFAMPYLLPIAAGGFIYIAAADFIPSLHLRAGLRDDFLQVITAVFGVCCMLGVSVFEQRLSHDGTPHHIVDRQFSTLPSTSATTRAEPVPP